MEGGIRISIFVVVVVVVDSVFVVTWHLFVTYFEFSTKLVCDLHAPIYRGVWHKPFLTFPSDFIHALIVDNVMSLYIDEVDCVLALFLFIYF